MPDWNTPEMIHERLSMLAEDLTTRMYNEGMKAQYKTETVNMLMRGFRWVSVQDARVCKICTDREGRVWGKSFFPPLPAHIRCRCVWEVVLA